jgi:hypothetical protein
MREEASRRPLPPTRERDRGGGRPGDDGGGGGASPRDNPRDSSEPTTACLIDRGGLELLLERLHAVLGRVLASTHTPGRRRGGSL